MLFNNPVRTSKRTPHFTITTINWLTLFKFNGILPALRGSKIKVFSKQHGDAPRAFTVG
jgi:hypothetical protein